MRLDELVKTTAAQLQKCGIENFECEARWLTLECCHSSATDLLLQKEVDAASEAQLAELIRRRCRHEPLQYLLGTAFFGEFELEVTPDVLIPRPETELLAQWAADNLPQRGKLLDIGCGSGAIPIYVAAKRPDAVVTAVDISPGALSVARRNAAKILPPQRITFYESDLFAALTGERFDLITANLPYVTFDEYTSLQPEVRCYEPQLALTADDNGMAIINRCISEITNHLFPCGKVIFELSPHQAEQCSTRLSQAGFAASIMPDQFGKNRFVTGQLLQ